MLQQALLCMLQRLLCCMRPTHALLLSAAGVFRNGGAHAHMAVHPLSSTRPCWCTQYVGVFKLRPTPPTSFTVEAPTTTLSPEASNR